MVRRTPDVRLLTDRIRNIPDFPKPGIVFRDVTTLFKDKNSFRGALTLLADHYASAHIDKVVGIEARGFILGAALADRLNAGFVPARKSGKLPSIKARAEYSLEYGSDAIEIHTDAIQKGDRVLLHDDLLATGGTMAAAVQLVRELGGTVVGICFLVELTFLGGAKRLQPQEVFSIIRYDSE